MFWGYESFYIHGLEKRLEEVRDVKVHWKAYTEECQ
jgi:hypothetical protein